MRRILIPFDAVRSASWLDGHRAIAYVRILLAITVVLAVVVAVVAVRHEGWDFSGKPLGTDFLCFWSAARLALAGTPAAAYDPSVAHALERATFGGPDPGYYAFIYPPVTLLLCLPLGLLPYLVALPAWLATTGAAYAGVVWTFVGRDRRLVPAMLAYPAVLLTCAHGQNAFLTTALMGGGILLLDRKRPILAGLLFGSLIVKPHLGLLIPLYLLATGERRALLAAGVAVAAWGLSSVAVFGPAPWVAYAKAATLARITLEQGLVEPEKLQSVFAAVRLWHGPLWLAYGGQAISALAAAAGVVTAARRGADRLASGAVLVTGALLTTPYVLDYDLTLLAIPLAWLYVRGRTMGFLAWDKSLGAAVYLLPMVSRLVATTVGLPLGPLMMWGLFGLLIRRCDHETTVAAAVRGAGTTTAPHPSIVPRCAGATALPSRDAA